MRSSTLLRRAKSRSIDTYLRGDGHNLSPRSYVKGYIPVSMRILFLLLWLPLTLFAQAPRTPAELFTRSEVMRIEVFLPADSLERLIAIGRLGSNHEFPSEVVLSGAGWRDSLSNVGFRMRGNTSRQALKIPFRLSFNEWNRSQRFAGVRKLNLVGEHNDPTLSRQRIALELAHEAGIPVARAGHAELYVNGQLRGVYTTIEQVDDEFLRERFADISGNLYKCSYPANLAWRPGGPDAYKFTNGRDRVYELRNNEEEDDYTDLATLIDILHQPAVPADFSREIETILDVDQVLLALAFETLIGQWDGYWYNQNNYHLYRNPDTGKFLYLPYDLDNTFGIDWVGQTWTTRDLYRFGHPTEPRPLATRLLQVPAYRARYTLHVSSLMRTVLTPERIQSRVNQLRTQLLPYALRDPYRRLDYGFDTQAFVDGFSTGGQAGHVKQGIMEYVQARWNAAANQLDRTAIAPAITHIETRPRTPIPGQTVHLRARMSGMSALQQPTATVNVPGGGTIAVTLEPDSLQVFYAGSFVAPNAGTYAIGFSVRDQQGRTGQAQTQVVVGGRSTTIFINELLASNNTGIRTPQGTLEDWVELYNASDTDYSLRGHFLSDRPLSNPTRWALPDTTIAPKGYLLLWMDGQPDRGPVHGPFALSRSGEEVALFQQTSGGMELLDYISFGEQTRDVSFGRVPDGSANWQPIPSPTPRQPNPSPTSTALDESLVEAELHLYPVPARSHLRIRWTPRDPAQTGELFIHDALGRLVVQERLVGEHHVDTRGWMPGIYRVMVMHEGGSVHRMAVVVP